MTYHALIPVKALEQVKSRLADHLTLNQRKSLVLEMLSHVIQTLRASAQLERVWVVSPDPRVLLLAQAWGATALHEEQRGHNPALHAATLHALDAGANALLTISADLPLLRPSDITALVTQARQHEVVLAPSRDGSGTNALLVRPPLALPYLFGPNSFQRYQQEAQRLGLSSTHYVSSSLGLDIDTADDLALYWRYEIEGKAAHATYYQP